MYIISVLSLGGNEVKIMGIYNDELTCRSEYLKIISDIAGGGDNNANFLYEPIHMKLDLTYIYKKTIGYITSSKELWKVVSMHNVPEYNCADA